MFKLFQQDFDGALEVGSAAWFWRHQSRLLKTCMPSLLGSFMTSLQGGFLRFIWFLTQVNGNCSLLASHCVPERSPYRGFTSTQTWLSIHRNIFWKNRCIPQIEDFFRVPKGSPDRGPWTSTPNWTESGKILETEKRMAELWIIDHVPHFTVLFWGTSGARDPLARSPRCIRDYPQRSLHFYWSQLREHVEVSAFVAQMVALFLDLSLFGFDKSRFGEPHILAAEAVLFRLSSQLYGSHQHRPMESGQRCEMGRSCANDRCGPRPSYYIMYIVLYCITYIYYIDYIYIIYYILFLLYFTWYFLLLFMFYIYYILYFVHLVLFFFIFYFLYYISLYYAFSYYIVLCYIIFIVYYKVLYKMIWHYLI